MATFLTTQRGIGYLEVSYDELMAYSQLPMPVCDDCNKGLLPSDKLTVIPVLNMAYCEDCATGKLPGIVDYPEDRQVRHRREEFWCNFYGIKANDNTKESE